MDIGDIIRLAFFGFIFLSFFGGALGRKKQKQEAPTRPTELSESGGATPPRPVSQPPRGMIDPAPQEDVRPVRTVEATTGDAELAARAEKRRQEQLGRFGQVPIREDIRSSEREILERDLTDASPPMDLYPERQKRRKSPRAKASRRGSRTEGAEILRGWLEDPDTLGRAFIVKEVLDEPVGMRRRNQ